MKDKESLYLNTSIMIVDDSTANLEMLSGALKEWGYRVRPATNGKQALLASQNDPPDLILLDIMMPDMDGYEICSRLKENPVTKNIPVIFISAMDKIFDEVKGFSTGAVDYIAKPIQFPVLKSRVDTHIQLKFHRDHLERMVSERTKVINSLLSSIKIILIGVSVDNIISHWNNEAEIVFKTKSEEVLGRVFNESIIDWEWDRIDKELSRVISEGTPVFIKELRYLPDGNKRLYRFLNIKISPIKDIEDDISGYLIAGDDITEVRTMRIQTNHAQKLEAIGRLAAGIAHEINTPAQYIRDNTLFIQESLKQILDIINNFIQLHKYDNVCEKAGKIFDLLKTADYDFMSGEIPRAVSQTLEGIDRIAKIAASMKKFSHPGRSVKALSNVNKIIDDAVTISKNEWKYVSEIELDLDKDMKQIECFPDDLSRVFLNMIINAAHAIEEKEKAGKNPGEKGIIKISTRYTGGSVIITISDTGAGIQEENREKIFEPFFTTKEAGKGTGQGLSIAYDVVANRHKGQIDVESNIGKGTTFTITLPVKPDEN